MHRLHQRSTKAETLKLNYRLGLYQLQRYKTRSAWAAYISSYVSSTSGVVDSELAKPFPVQTLPFYSI